MAHVVTSTVLRVDHRRLVVAKDRRLADTLAADREGPRSRDLALVATEAEARWLAAARCEDVVALHRVNGTRIETAVAGTATLRTLAPALEADPATTAVVLAELALAVDRLHRRRLVHGRIGPDHLVASGPDRRRPRLRLCAPSGRAREPGVDVAGLALTTERLLDAWGGDPPGWRDLVEELRADGVNWPARHVAGRFERLARRPSLFSRVGRVGVSRR